jgi:hypothetical protein
MGCVIDDEFKRIWKEAAAAQSEVLLWNLGEGPEENKSEFLRKVQSWWRFEPRIYQTRNRTDTILQRSSVCSSCKALGFKNPKSVNY